MTTYVTFQKTVDDLLDAYEKHLDHPSADTKARVDELYEMCISYVNCELYAKAWNMELYTIGDFNNIDEAVWTLGCKIREVMASMEGIG